MLCNTTCASSLCSTKHQDRATSPSPVNRGILCTAKCTTSLPSWAPSQGRNHKSAGETPSIIPQQSICRQGCKTRNSRCGALHLAGQIPQVISAVRRPIDTTTSQPVYQCRHSSSEAATAAVSTVPMCMLKKHNKLKASLAFKANRQECPCCCCCCEVHTHVPH
jgi:hypothetical protein